MSYEKFSLLREEHPSCEVSAGEVEEIEGGVRLSFSVAIENLPVITPSIEIRGEIKKDLNPSLSALYSATETISYWKSCCPPLIKFSQSAPESYLNELFSEGLGEFYYVNSLLPLKEKPVTIQSGKDFILPEVPEDESYLLLVSGGKDSACLLDLFSHPDLKPKVKLLTVNNLPSTQRLATHFGFQKIDYVITRKIDPFLIELNNRGYLNGHTPFSALLASIGLLVADGAGIRYVVAANEWSANEENLKIGDFKVNHQYSKSFKFENHFRELTGERYFSALRPLTEERISKWFTELSGAHSLFRSCNVNQKSDSWCGKCPKCVFVWLMLAQYKGLQYAEETLGFDALSEKDQILSLAGLSSHKPLECVGTIEECRLALKRIIDLNPSLKESYPDFKVSMGDVGFYPHNLPGEVEKVLREKVK